MGVYYKTSAGGTWIELQTYSATIANWTHHTVNLPNLTSTYYIAFGAAAQSGYCVCVDLITVTKQSGNATPWVMFETSSVITDTIGPMSIFTYMVQFTSMILSPGTYTSSITIESNSHFNPLVVIPITLNVYAATLAPPVNLTIYPNEDRDGIILNWTAPPGFPDRYDIYKAYIWNYSDEVLIGSVIAPQTTFSDPSPFTMRKAYYRIRAVRD
jgi:hypothetical protein